LRKKVNSSLVRSGPILCIFVGEQNLWHSVILRVRAR